MFKNNLPFQSDIIYEAIITTYDQEKQSNAAPMGFIVNKEKQVIIKPYKESDTYKNLRNQKECIINITHDPDLFVKSTLFQDFLIDDFFIESSIINAPILKACKENHLALKVIKEKKEEDRGVYYCKIIQANLKKEYIQPYTRAFSSLIEILIHSTRVIYFSQIDGSNNPKVKQLMELIEHHSQIIFRVTQEHSQYQKHVKEILKKISQEVEE